MESILVLSKLKLNIKTIRLLCEELFDSTVYHVDINRLSVEGSRIMYIDYIDVATLSFTEDEAERISFKVADAICILYHDEKMLKSLLQELLELGKLIIDDDHGFVGPILDYLDYKGWNDLWSADFTNNPLDDYNIVCEISYKNYGVGRLKVIDNKLVLQWYGTSNEIQMPMEWFNGLYAETERRLIDH